MGASGSALRRFRVSSTPTPLWSDSNSTSRARFRALVRAVTTHAPRARRLGGRWSVDAPEVAAVAGVDPDLLARGDEQRDLDVIAGLKGRGLGATRRTIALKAGLGVGDRQLDGRGQLDVERRAIVDSDDSVLVLKHDVRCVAHRLGRHT